MNCATSPRRKCGLLEISVWTSLNFRQSRFGSSVRYASLVTILEETDQPGSPLDVSPAVKASPRVSHGKSCTESLERMRDSTSLKSLSRIRPPSSSTIKVPSFWSRRYTGSARLSFRFHPTRSTTSTLISYSSALSKSATEVISPTQSGRNGHLWRSRTAAT